MIPTIKYTVAGHYHLAILNELGEVNREYDFDNLITDTGLDFIGAPHSWGTGQGLIGFCYLGTGTTIPAFTDTGLTTYGTANSTTGSSSPVASYVAGPPTLWQYVYTYTFAAGVATGTWSEIAMGPVTPPNLGTPPTGAYAFSHALIVDGGGAPTTISILSSEQLVVTYTLQVFFTTTDISYPAFLINTTSTTGVLRPALISTVSSSFPGLGAGGLNGASLWTGSLGSITSTPSGTQVAQSSQSAGSYVGGSHTIPLNFTWTGSPTIGTWTAILTGSTLGMYQFTVSPAIVISSGATFSLTINVSWARH